MEAQAKVEIEATAVVPMWRPPERIRHNASAGRWPNAAEAAAARLFSPCQGRARHAGPTNLGTRHGSVAGERGRVCHSRGIGVV